MNRLDLIDLESKMQAFICDNQLEKRRRGPPPKLSLARLACVCIAKSWYNLPSWKTFFNHPLIKKGWKEEYGWELGSYGRFMLALPRVKDLLNAWVESQSQALVGLGAVDSTLIAWGKTWNRYDLKKYKHIRKSGCNTGHGSTGLCFGVKLHVVSTDQGHIHTFSITPASVSDLTLIKKGLLDKAIGIVLADRGYISKKEQQRLQAKSLALWARPRKNQETQFCSVQKKLYHFREIAESIFAKLKQSFGLVPTWPPRRMTTGCVHILSCLAAYSLDENKPKMNWNFNHFGYR